MTSFLGKADFLENPLSAVRQDSLENPVSADEVPDD